MSKQENLSQKIDETENSGSTKRKAVGQKVLSLILVVLILLTVFFSGYYTFYWAMGEEMRQLLWIKKQITNNYYYDVTDEQFFEAVVDGGGVESLLDAYSDYYSPDEYKSIEAQNKGIKYGVGLSFENVEDTVRIFKVLGNSPAEKAGLKEGMIITGVGLTSDDITAVNDFNKLFEFIDPIAENAEFILTAKIAVDEPEVSYTVSKQDYNQSFVNYSSKTTSYGFLSDNFSGNLTLKATENAKSGLDNDTAYIQLTQFSGDATSQFKQVLDVFKAERKKNLILDLRNNGGGQLQILTEICSYLVNAPKNSVVAIAKYKNKFSQEYRMAKSYYNDYFSEDSKLYVLANKNTASASECLIGALIDYNTLSYDNLYLSNINGEGAKTYGKGIMQMTYLDIFTGSAIKLTVAQIYWPQSQKCIHQVGVTSSDGAKSVDTASAVTYNDLELTEIISSICG